jgi:predicted N-acetyltransferase YhbS
MTNPNYYDRLPLYGPQAGELLPLAAVTKLATMRQASGAAAMEIETLDRRRMSQADARSIAELLVAIWPKAGRTVESRSAEMLNRWSDYRGPESQFPRSFVVREGGQVIAHASAEPRTIGTTFGDMMVLALARVCTDPAARGRHLGQAVARAALELVDRGTFPFALFQTSEAVRPFYERLGAVPVTNRFINSLADDPQKNPWWDAVVMRYPAAGVWPSGVVDLRGTGW